MAIAKDVWLLGIGIGLLTRGTIDRKPRVTVKKANKQPGRQAKLAAREAEGRKR